MNKSHLVGMILLLCGLMATSGGCDSPAQKSVTQTDQQNQNEAAESGQDDAEAKVASPNADGPTVAKGKERSLFDGKTLDGWETIEFGGEGDIKVVDGTIHMYAGELLTGISVTEDTELPKVNYQISLEAMRLSGSDFFAGVTFPVNDSFCTLIVGGWGGSLVGLSNLDGRDASENETKLMKKFDDERWYAIRIEVRSDRISAWIDDEKLIDQSIEGVEVSIRGDVGTTTPLGITNFATSCAVRDIKLQSLE